MPRERQRPLAGHAAIPRHLPTAAARLAFADPLHRLRSWAMGQRDVLGRPRYVCRLGRLPRPLRKSVDDARRPKNYPLVGSRYRQAIGRTDLGEKGSMGLTDARS